MAKPPATEMVVMATSDGKLQFVPKSESGSSPVSAQEAAAEPFRTAATTQIDWKQIIDQWLPIIIDEFKKTKPPEPSPDPGPSPNPPPGPTPPGPAPHNSLKIVFSDESGKTISGNTVDAGIQLLATLPLDAADPSSIAKDIDPAKYGWQVARHGSVQMSKIPNNLGYSFTLNSQDAYAEFFLTHFPSSKQIGPIRVVANHAPQPPPGPVPPGPTPPTPDPIPDPSPPDVGPSNRILGLVVFADVNATERNPAFSKLTTSKYWEELGKRHKVAVFPRNTNDKDGKLFLTEIAGTLGAVLLIREEGGEKLAVVPLPQSESTFETEIQKWSSRK